MERQCRVNYSIRKITSISYVEHLLCWRRFLFSTDPHWFWWQECPTETRKSRMSSSYPNLFKATMEFGFLSSIFKVFTLRAPESNNFVLRTKWTDIPGNHFAFGFHYSRDTMLPSEKVTFDDSMNGEGISLHSHSQSTRGYRATGRERERDANVFGCW